MRVHLHIDKVILPAQLSFGLEGAMLRLEDSHCAVRGESNALVAF